jgi:hypothetical protein
LAGWGLLAGEAPPGLFAGVVLAGAGLAGCGVLPGILPGLLSGVGLAVAECAPGRGLNACRSWTRGGLADALLF